MPGRRRRRRRRKRRQRCGASLSTVRRIMHKGPSLRDKIAGTSMFLSGPEPCFAALGRLLGKKTFKGVSDSVKGYIRRR